MSIAQDVSISAPVTSRRMTEAATRFLASLDPSRLAAARFAFADNERYRWNYRPDGFFWDGSILWHAGLRLVNMSAEQQQAALALLDTGLSPYGAARTRSIMALERHLREAERVVAGWAPHVVRDPELYSFAIFGEPNSSSPWSWRVGGHHLGLHFTIVDHQLVAPTPSFFGANPAEVRYGSDIGLRTLPEEEDRARDLLQALDPQRRRTAIVSSTAPGDILTDAYRSANPAVPPRGIAWAALAGDERERLARLIRLYVDRTPEEVASAQWHRIERAGLESITFAWAGGTEPGQPHYYAVEGPTFVIEYDKTQDGANHIHSVLRDFTDDWGEDLLAAHYAQAHRASASTLT